MKNLLFIAAFLFTGYFGFSQQVYVSGYTKSNGTYVQGHYRTAPNNTVNDNWSTRGNVNPYTGKSGYKPRENSYTPPKTYNYNTYSTPKKKTFTPTTNFYKTPSYNTNSFNSTVRSTYKPIKTSFSW